MAGLRDIYVPNDFKVSFFPLAYGWWLLIALIISVIVLYFFSRKIILASIRYYCMKQMEYLAEEYQINHNLQSYAEGVSVLLKRYAIFRFGRKNVATLYGEEWKRFLAKNSNTSPNNKILDTIVNAPYSPNIYGEADIKGYEAIVKAFVGWRQKGKSDS